MRNKELDINLRDVVSTLIIVILIIINNILVIITIIKIFMIYYFIPLMTIGHRFSSWHCRQHHKAMKSDYSLMNSVRTATGRTEQAAMGTVFLQASSFRIPKCQ